jgi:hypothetical protein
MIMAVAMAQVVLVGQAQHLERAERPEPRVPMVLEQSP